MRSLLFVSVIFLLVNGCTQKGEDRIFILPNAFVGFAVIIYNQSDGESVEYEGNKRLFKVPSSGVLKTKFTADYGRASFPEFYYESISEQNRIPLVIDAVDYSQNEVNVSMPNIGKVYPDNELSEPIEYSIFFVGTKEEIERASNEIKKIKILELR
jgi:hypothetical protein